MVLSQARVKEFREGILRHYREEGRDFPWRKTFDPWLILVSEVMLQQTRTETVLGKWPAFAAAFPDPFALCRASLTELLTLWKGLGYNRRALALRNAATRIVEAFDGTVPRSERDLLSLPGVGPYTARAIRAFAFGEPDLVLETNIRSVFLFYFFPERTGVADSEIEPCLAQTLLREDPRTWYYALMDYGAALKRREPNPGRRGAAYSRQSPFEGSHRQLRAAILHTLAARGPLRLGRLKDMVQDARLERALSQLVSEGFLESCEGQVRLKN